MKKKKIQGISKKLTSAALICSLAVSGTAVSGVHIPNAVTTVKAATVSGQKFEADGIEYQVLSNNIEVEVVGLTDAATQTDIAIPATISYDNYEFSITGIAASAFEGNTTLQSITMGANIKTIGKSAFSKCSNLVSVSLNEGLTTLGTKCFRATGLTAIILPSTLTTVIVDYSSNPSPFYECDGLKNITFAEGTTTIANDLFGGFTTLTDITIPETVTAIKDSAFCNCPNLTHITFPETLETIGKEAFYNCSALTELTLPKAITEIGTRAFGACSGLTEVTIPNSLTTVTVDYFRNESPFYSCQNLTKVTFQEGITSVPKYILNGAAYVTEVDIPETVTRIEQYAFQGCTSLVSISLPSNLEFIGSEAFQNDTAMETLILPGTLTEIGPRAFAFCTRLTEVTIPNSLTTVTVDYFRNESPFYSCQNLTKVTFQEGITSVPKYILNGAAYVTEVDIPETVTRIEQEAFQGCTSLVSVSLPSNLEFIGSEAFQNDTAMETLILPDTLTEIGPRAFASCTRLKEVTIPNSLTTVTNNYNNNKSPFYDCKSLTKVIFQEGTTSIPKYILDGAAYVTEVIIPETVTEIGDEAFQGCSALKTITIPSSVTAIGAKSFNNHSADLEIYGYTNSYAETYATDNHIPFVSIGEFKPIIPVGTDAPIQTDVPASNMPATDVPTTDVPVTETPATDVPTTDVPVTETPATNVPTETETPIEPTVTEAPVGSTKLISTKYIVGKGEKVTIGLTGGSGVKFVSNNTKIATVTEKKGVVTAKKVGTVKIKVTDEFGETKTVTIVVRKAPTQKTFKASVTKKSLKIGKTFTLKPKFTTGYYSNAITYTSSKKTVATVTAKGVVEAKKKGTTVITMTTYNGKKAKATITVK